MVQARFTIIVDVKWQTCVFIRFLIHVLLFPHQYVWEISAHLFPHQYVWEAPNGSGSCHWILSGSSLSSSVRQVAEGAGALQGVAWQDADQVDQLQLQQSSFVAREQEGEWELGGLWRTVEEGEGGRIWVCSDLGGGGGGQDGGEGGGCGGWRGSRGQTQSWGLDNICGGKTRWPASVRGGNSGEHTIAKFLNLYFKE